MHLKNQLAIFQSSVSFAEKMKENIHFLNPHIFCCYCLKEYSNTSYSQRELERYDQIKMCAQMCMIAFFSSQKVEPTQISFSERKGKQNGTNQFVTQK